jgi:regulatory protein
VWAVDRVEQRPRQPPKSKAPKSLRARALEMLARREHSRRELEHILAGFAENPGEISELLNDFERRGWLSEQRAADQMASSRRRRYGVQRIVRDMRERGIVESAIDAVLPVLQESELDSARAVWQRKFGSAPKAAADRARQVRFLQGRGFSLDTALRVVSGKEDADD